jgi:hypothetical protein
MDHLFTKIIHDLFMECIIKSLIYVSLTFVAVTQNIVFSLQYIATNMKIIA